MGTEGNPLSNRPQSPHVKKQPEGPQSLEDVQREHIIQVLRQQKGNIKATAQILGISRTTLYKKIRDYDIDAPV